LSSSFISHQIEAAERKLRRLDAEPLIAEVRRLAFAGRDEKFVILHTQALLEPQLCGIANRLDLRAVKPDLFAHILALAIGCDGA
jgi:hypothetical protein